jgi:hypothetical protein
MNEKGKLSKRFTRKWKQSSTKSRFWITFLLWNILLVIFSIFIKIPFLLDTPWVTVMIYVPFTPVLLYSLGIMFRPSITFFIVFFGLTFGEIIFCLIFGCGGEFLFFLLKNLLSQGLGSMVCSFFRKKNEFIALILGGLWMFFGLFFTSYIYYVLILNWGDDYIIVYSLIFGGFYLLFIPLSILLNVIFRKMLRIRYLEDLIFYPGNK